MLPGTVEAKGGIRRPMMPAAPNRPSFSSPEKLSRGINEQSVLNQVLALNADFIQDAYAFACETSGIHPDLRIGAAIDNLQGKAQIEVHYDSGVRGAAEVARFVAGNLQDQTGKPIALKADKDNEKDKKEKEKSKDEIEREREAERYREYMEKGKYLEIGLTSTGDAKNC